VSSGSSSSKGDSVEVDNEYEEEVVEEVDDEQQLYVMPAPDVQTYVKFLGISDNKFVAGEEVTALVGLHNVNTHTTNSTAIARSFDQWILESNRRNQRHAPLSSAHSFPVRSCCRSLLRHSSFSLLPAQSGPKTYNVSFVGAHLHSPFDQVRDDTTLK
jgi:hypothetical protein